MIFLLGQYTANLIFHMFRMDPEIVLEKWHLHVEEAVLCHGRDTFTILSLCDTSQHNALTLVPDRHGLRAASIHDASTMGGLTIFHSLRFEDIDMLGSSFFLSFFLILQKQQIAKYPSAK